MLILSYQNELNLHVNENSFSYERMSTKTRFEKEATGNSEMAYCLLIRLNIKIKMIFLPELIIIKQVIFSSVKYCLFNVLRRPLTQQVA